MCSVLQTGGAANLFPRNKISFGNKMPGKLVLPYDVMAENWFQWTNANN